MSYLDEWKKKSEAAKAKMDTAKQNYLDYEKDNPFKFDVNEDALYNQAVENYTKQGQLAMKDTMGQAAALTGGYGNSYAQTAGQQVYNAYLDQANDIIPEAYQRALDRYNAGKENLLAEYTFAADEYSRASSDIMSEMEMGLAEENLSKTTYSGKSTAAGEDLFDNGVYSDYEVSLAQKLIGSAIPDGKWRKDDAALAEELGYGDLGGVVNRWRGVQNKITAADVEKWTAYDWDEFFTNEDQASVRALCKDLLEDNSLSKEARERIQAYLDEDKSNK